MLDAKKEMHREICRREYHVAIRQGCFHAARKMLRNALVWRSPTARARSKEWDYGIRKGKMYAFEYNCSY